MMKICRDTLGTHTCLCLYKYCLLP